MHLSVSKQVWHIQPDNLTILSSAKFTLFNSLLGGRQDASSNDINRSSSREVLGNPEGAAFTSDRFERALTDLKSSFKVSTRSNEWEPINLIPLMNII